MSDGTETNYAPDAMSEMTEDDRPPPGSSEDEDDESLNEHVAENQLRYSSLGDEEEHESGDDDEGGAGSDNADEEEFDDDELDERALEEDVDYIDRNGGRQSLEEDETAAALVEAIIDQENNRTATAGQPTSVLTSNVALGSLLKYDTPVSVSKAAFTTDDVVFSTPPTLAAIHGAADEPGGRLSATPGTSSLSAVEQLLSQVAGSSSSTAGSGSAAAAAKKGMQQVIDMILPPIVWEQDGQLWMQQVSSKPATRLDVLNLQRLLDMRLEHRQAKETGICPIRRELYTQAFDELIRQVTVNCAERGLLLLRVRDELKMTLSAYQTLFESSCAFGIRKTLQAREGREELERRVESLEKEKQALLEECDRLRGQLDDAKRLHEEQRAVEANTHKEKVEFYQHKVQQIKNQLEAILAAKK